MYLCKTNLYIKVTQNSSGGSSCEIEIENCALISCSEDFVQALHLHMPVFKVFNKVE